LQHSSTTDQNGRQWLFFDQIDSTNNEATRQMALKSVKSGDIIFTNHQTKGKGQRGKGWVGDHGMNLAMTYIYLPQDLRVENTFFLNQAVSLACMDMLRAHNFSHQSIKWPNDIYLGQKKAGGILIQNSLTGRLIQQSIIGIGINVNQEQFDKELPNPTSLKLELEKNWMLESLMADLVAMLDLRLEQMELGRLDAIHEQYMDHLFLKGIRHQYEVDGKWREGIIEDVARSGKLQVRFGAEIESFQFGQIRYDTSGNNHHR